MKPYNSKSGKSSGVTGYRPGKDYIIIQFEGGKTYRYTYATAGEQHVEMMKELAARQEGLSTYISQHDPGYE